MNPFEFLSYEATPGEKQLGIATIRAWGKIILKYKIVEKKEGGFFESASSIKNGTDGEGKDNYEKVFMIDSMYETQQIKKLIEHHVRPYAKQPSLFDQQSTNIPNSTQSTSGMRSAQNSANKPLNPDWQNIGFTQDPNEPTFNGSMNPIGTGEVPF